MLLNSINYAFKDAFYNLEKLFSGLKTSSLQSSERDRLHAINNHKGIEASMASGEFLTRARRGETLHPDKETEEICKDFVRAKAVFPADESFSVMPEEPSVAEVMTKSITEEIPVFGLKASLHATTDHVSFDAWKSVHQWDSEEEVEQENQVDANEITTNQLKAVGKAWRELSVHTALRLIDHPHTPGFVLAELAQHPASEVRAQVPDNPNTPKEALLQLLSDESIDVRLSLAECYHLGISILDMLVDDENPYVCDRAETTLQRLRANTSPSVIRGLFGLTGVTTHEEENVTQFRARA